MMESIEKLSKFKIPVKKKKNPFTRISYSFFKGYRCNWFFAITPKRIIYGSSNKNDKFHKLASCT